jgi:c-di-GMP-related signal transduction protein
MHPTPHAAIYLARQPIFDAYMQVHAYELLYRATAENRFVGAPGDLATSSVIAHTFLSVGFENVTGGKLAFINFPRQLILDDVALALPRDRVAVEVLEDVQPDPEIIAAIGRLKSAGYTVALDDFVLLTPEYEPLLALADVVKVDWRSSSPDQQETLARRCAEQGPHMLAEKVETEAEFERALTLGCRYFQGFFFARPQMVSAQEVPGFKLNYLRLLKQIQAPRLDYDAIERIIKAEGALLHWLLRCVNSAAFGFRSKINSIRHAIVALGESELRKWVSVFCIAGMGEDRPRELLVQSFVRASFCEQLSAISRQSKHQTEAFLVGMLSILDAILARPLSDLVDELPLSPETRSALLFGSGPLAPILSCALAYERAEWDAVNQFARQLRMTGQQVAAAYLDSLDKAEQIFGEVLPEPRIR